MSSEAGSSDGVVRGLVKLMRSSEKSSGLVKLKSATHLKRFSNGKRPSKNRRSSKANGSSNV